jgi:hypothetical protein
LGEDCSKAPVTEKNRFHRKKPWSVIDERLKEKRKGSAQREGAAPLASPRGS